MIQFEMVGKLSFGKDSDKFKSYEETKYPSGWENHTLKTTCVSGDNVFYLQNKAGFFSDGHGDCYVFSKGYTDENGKKVKGEAFRIPFKDRLKSKRLPEVAAFKLFVIDTEEHNRRWELKRAIDQVKEGKEISDKDLEKLGVESSDKLEEALIKSEKKRKEFIHMVDFVDHLKKVIDSGKYEGRNFVIKGEYEMQYSDDKERWYCNYVPQRIYLADSSLEETSTANVVLFYDNESLYDGKVEEEGKYYINGHVQVYDNSRKENIFAPYTIVLEDAPEGADEKEKKKAAIRLKRFTVDEDDETVYELGCVVDLLNGSQQVELDESMLTEDQQDALLCGDITEKELIEELGGKIYGDKVTENKFSKLIKGYSKGRNESVFTADDLEIKSVGSEDDDDVEDLFADDDDL